MENLAHIKINQPGGVAIAPDIRITRTVHDLEAGDFGPFPENKFNQKYTDIKFKLPFVANLDLNYKVGDISFVLLNNQYRYYARDIKGTVYLFPWGTFYKDIQEDLPVIKLGKTDDWRTKLNMDLRMIVWALIEDKDGEFIMADFKTSSKNSIKSFQRYIDSLSYLRVNERYEITSSMFIKSVFESGRNVYYMSFSDIVSDLRNIPENHRKVSAASIERHEEFYKEEEKNLIKNAVSMSDADKFFNSKIVISIDNSLNLDFSSFGKTSSMTKKDDLDIENSEALVELLENKVPEKVAKALIMKYGEQAGQMAKQAEYKTGNIIKLL